jgi:hypothetical protein
MLAGYDDYRCWLWLRCLATLTALAGYALQAGWQTVLDMLAGYIDHAGWLANLVWCPAGCAAYAAWLGWLYWMVILPRYAVWLCSLCWLVIFAGSSGWLYWLSWICGLSVQDMVSVCATYAIWLTMLAGWQAAYACYLYWLAMLDMMACKSEYAVCLCRLCCLDCLDGNPSKTVYNG